VSITVLYDETAAMDVEGRPDGDRLWLSPADLESATGWTLKPEGLCREEACVPLAADGSWQDSDGRVDVTAFASHMGRPVVRDAQHAVWAFGEPAQARDDRRHSLQAPDFTLPDLDGRPHSLSDHRGSKVFLLAWGSY
jgi:AhpC/TSA family